MRVFVYEMDTNMKVPAHKPSSMHVAMQSQGITHTSTPTPGGAVPGTASACAVPSLACAQHAALLSWLAVRCQVCCTYITAIGTRHT